MFYNTKTYLKHKSTCITTQKRRSLDKTSKLVQIYMYYSPTHWSPSTRNIHILEVHVFRWLRHPFPESCTPRRNRHVCHKRGRIQANPILFKLPRVSAGGGLAPKRKSQIALWPPGVGYIKLFLTIRFVVKTLLRFWSW
jgi:hypothetical protein